MTDNLGRALGWGPLLDRLPVAWWETDRDLRILRCGGGSAAAALGVGAGVTWTWAGRAAWSTPLHAPGTKSTSGAVACPVSPR